MMTLKEFLKSENPELYDLKNENGYKGKTPLGKMKNYKENTNDGFDCDGSGEGKGNHCELIREIYRDLWGWTDKDENGYIKRYANIIYAENDLKMGPETMNSFATTYNQIVKQNESDDDLINLWAETVGRIGNMTLTYAGFNKYIAYDYWDIKLKRQYFENESLNDIEKTRYVNLFFQWDYVEKKEKYTFKSFWDGHESYYLPRDIDTIKNYINLIDAYTQRRGLFMVAMLKIYSLCKEDYQKIVQEVFLSNEIFKNGYDDVISKALMLTKNKEVNDILETVKININHINTKI